MFCKCCTYGTYVRDVVQVHSIFKLLHSCAALDKNYQASQEKPQHSSLCFRKKCLWVFGIGRYYLLTYALLELERRDVVTAVYSYVFLQKSCCVNRSCSSRSLISNDAKSNSGE